MKIRKFCLCGKKLEREACDEESAFQAVTLWRQGHNGPDCGIANKAQYDEAIKRLIQSKVAQNRND